MNFFRNEKGSITIYLVIVFMALLMLTGLLIDLARIKVAQNQLRRVANSSARSVLANYDTSVKNDYNLFVAQESSYNKDFLKYIQANLVPQGNQDNPLLDYRIEKSELYPIRTLKDDIQQQILEDMKYQAPLNLTRDLLDKFRSVGKLGKIYEEENAKRKNLSQINGKVKELSDSNKLIKLKKDEIKQKIKALNNDQELIKKDSTIKKLKSEIAAEVEKDKTVLQEIEAEGNKTEVKNDLSKYDNEEANIINDEQIRKELENSKIQINNSIDEIKIDLQKTEGLLKESEVKEESYDQIGLDSADRALKQMAGDGNSVTVQDEEVLKRKKDLVKDSTIEVPDDAIDRDSEKYQNNNAQKDQTNVNIFKKIFGLINDNQNLYKLRDEIYTNEYMLTHFSYLTSEPKGTEKYANRNTEVEYILYGTDKPKVTAITKLWEIRFAFDTAAYFALSKNAPPHPLARAVASLVVGSIQASIDTYELAKGKEVAIAEVFPPETNLLKDIKVNYKDHLRLLLLISDKKKEEKLDGILQVLQRRSGLAAAKANTVVEGKVKISIRMLFLPLSGFKNIKNGPFGTEIKNGRAFISKEVQYGY